MSDSSSFEYIRIDKNDHVAEVVLNRPQKYNVMDDQFFMEIGSAMDLLRVIILWSEGKVFTAGLDLKTASSNFINDSEESKAVQNLFFYKLVHRWQAQVQMFTPTNLQLRKIQECPKPVIAAVHSKCIGGGVDLISWCDVRLGTEDCEFSIKETQIAMVADLGTLQRISKITAKGFAREMAFSGGSVSGQRAYHFGLLNHLYPNQSELLKGARALAQSIASNSPLAVQGTKTVLNYSDEHSTQEGLEYVALWNSAFLQSDDLTEAVLSFLQKKTPAFRNKL